MSMRDKEERRGMMCVGMVVTPARDAVAAAVRCAVFPLFLLLSVLLPPAPAVAQQPAPLSQGIPVIPSPSRPARSSFPPGRAPTEAHIEQAKQTALEYLRFMAGGTLPKPEECEPYLHPDAVWPRSDPYSTLLVLPEIRVVDVGFMPKTINLWNPDVEFVVSVVVQADVIGRISQLLEVKQRAGTAQRTIDLIVHNGQYRVIDMSRPLVRWAFPDAAVAWAGLMQGRSPRYREVRTRLESLAERTGRTAEPDRSLPAVP